MWRGIVVQSAVFFFNDTATTKIYTLSLHDALPICVLEMRGSVAKNVRVPWPQDFPPGPLAVTKLDPQLLQMGLATPQELGAALSDEEIREQRALPPEQRIRILSLADKLRLLFDATYPGV